MPLTTRDEAETTALEYLDASPAGRRHALVIERARTREEPFGWVFFYNSRRFIDSGDPQHSLGGNAPLIVDRDSGAVVPTGTARDIDYYISYYAKNRSLIGAL